MYQWKKDIVEWRCGKTLYLSVPFTWMLDEAKLKAEEHKGKVVAGGPAVKLHGAEWADETPDECPFDVLSMHNPCATFTTRGCPNRCEYCAVPQIEGDFWELEAWKPAPIVCDNNLLESSKKHFQRVIDSLMQFPVVDFNQGLDARRFTPWHAGQIARLKCAKVRFAFDFLGMEAKVFDAIATAREAGLKDFGVYVLIGFNDTPEDAKYRLDKVMEWGVLPNAQRFQPLDAKKRNVFVHPNWTEWKLYKMARYYTRTIYVGHVPYGEFMEPDEPLLNIAENMR